MFRPDGHENSPLQSAAATVLRRRRYVGAMTSYLFTRRKRYVSPHKLLEEGLLPFLRELVMLLDAVGVFTLDERWDDQLEKLLNAREALLAPSEAIKELRAQAAEDAHVHAMLREIHRHPQIVESIRKLRKPMARVAGPKLLAAKVLRRR